MGIFTRFKDIVNANISAMLEKAEDPEKMIKLMIREMEDTLIEIKSSCAAAIAASKRIQRRQTEVSELTKGWADRAELAVNKGRDELAREALIEKRRFAEQEELLENELQAQFGIIDQYKHDIVELEQKLNSAKDKKRLLIERHKQATGKKRAQQEIRRFNSTDTFTRFDKMESRIEQLEAEADLVNPKVKPTLEQEFAELATDNEIEKELAQLKASKQNDESH
jgi:phage shock protein A